MVTTSKTSPSAQLNSRNAGNPNCSCGVCTCVICTCDSGCNCGSCKVG